MKLDTARPATKNEEPCKELRFEEEQISCPLCGSGSDRHRTFLVRGRNGIYIESGGRLFNDRHVFCDGCGLIFINPRLTESSLWDFYRYRYRDLYSMPDDGALELELIHAKFREQFLKSTGRLIGDKCLLEVGGSSGAFAYLMRRLGVNTVSVEPNETRTRQAREIYGVEHVPSVIEEFETDRKFDIVTMFDAFEHLASPGKFLDKVSGLLRDDGILYLELPTVYLPRSGVIGFFSAAHTFSYSEATLGYLLEKYGFRIEYLDQQGHRRDLRILARKASGFRKSFPRKDRLATLATIWQGFDKIRSEVEPQIREARQRKAVEGMVDSASRTYPYFRGYLHALAAMSLARHSIADAYAQISPVLSELFSEEGGVHRSALGIIVALYHAEQGKLHSAYAAAREVERALPAIHELDPFPAGLNLEKLRRILRAYGLSPDTVYRLLSDLADRMGQGFKKEEYARISAFYQNLP